MTFDDFPLTSEQRNEMAARGRARYLEVLQEKGVLPPASHFEEFDPPLTRIEQRHWVHERYCQSIAGCRFCVTRGTE